MRPTLTHPTSSILTLGSLAALAALALTALPVGAAGATTTTTAAGASAESQYQAAVKAATGRGVHFVSVASQDGVSIRVVGDAGATSGHQTLVVSKGSLTERVTEELVGKTAYLQANSAALERVIGLTNAESTKYAGTWLSFPSSTQGLSQLVGGLLDSQIASEIAMSGPYTLGDPASVNGQKVVAIEGQQATSTGTKATTVLYVPTSGTRLPVEEVTNPGKNGGGSAVHGTVTFSNWGETTSVTRPAHSRSLLAVARTSTGSSTSTTAGG